MSLTIEQPALTASMLTVYAYALPASGPLAIPPPKSLVSVDVSSRSKKCRIVGGARVCRFSLAVPATQDAIAATLSKPKRILGEAFVALDAGQPATLALTAGAVAPATLSMVIPALRGTAFNVAVTALQADGTVLMTDPLHRPIEVDVYGPRGIVSSSHAAVGGRGVVASFAYGGQKFPNPMTVTAIAGKSSITGQLFPPTTPVPGCKVLGETRAVHIPERDVLAPKGGGFFLYASVAGGNPVHVQLDTGSTTFLLSKNYLVGALASKLIGPGQSATETLYPSHVTLYGNYYLAPVTLYDSGGTHELGTTVPMEVLIVDKSCRPIDGKQTCEADKGTSYMGVGFGRPSPSPTSGFLRSPLENPLLQLDDIVVGKMHPGFILTRDGLWIGLNRSNARGFSFVNLDPFPERPGDWQGPKACVRFNRQSDPCGRMLLDVGIDSMVVQARTPQPLTSIEIVAPTAQRPLLDYSFAYPVAPGATPPAPNPLASVPVAFGSKYPPNFVNTGRDALAAADYLYDEACGQVGFRVR
ncbi:MAG: hypothetical protein JO092_06395 [Candidatus Eremiobacteraeota bacterium]|nr:hypothetical protein [Candidatus Eremiobacteraeota bacterium]